MESAIIKRITDRTKVCSHYATELLFTALYNNDELMAKVLEEIDAELKDNEFYAYNPHEARLRREDEMDLSDIDFNSKQEGGSMLKAKDVFSVWRASCDIRIDLPLMKGIVKRYKKETKNYFDDELLRLERAMHDARLK